MSAGGRSLKGGWLGLRSKTVLIDLGLWAGKRCPSMLICSAAPRIRRQSIQCSCSDVRNGQGHLQPDGAHSPGNGRLIKFPCSHENRWLTSKVPNIAANENSTRQFSAQVDRIHLPSRPFQLVSPRLTQNLATTCNLPAWRGSG